MTTTLVAAMLTITLAASAENLDVYRGCGLDGNATSPCAKAINVRKNRWRPPMPAQIDPAITMPASRPSSRNTRSARFSRTAIRLTINRSGRLSAPRATTARA